jgi:hypothetical protein
MLSDDMFHGMAMENSTIFWSCPDLKFKNFIEITNSHKIER